MRAHSTRIALGAAAIAIVLAFGLTTAQAQNKCLAGKTKCVNKKVAGLLNCQAKCQKDPLQCGGAETMCEDKVRAKFDGGGVKLGCFDQLEVKNDGPCVTFGDRAAMETRVDVFVSGTVTTLEGGAAAPCTAFPATGQTTSYGPNSDGNIQAGATLAYQDNGDGTITDLNTGLMWEKKSDDGSIHDHDNTYTWGMTSSPYTMNGTIVTSFLSGLNAGGGFAGHIDWRIPNVKELQSIVNYQIAYPSPTVSSEFNTGCAPGCTVLTCSCTAAHSYWSSTTYALNPDYAWVVVFYGGCGLRLQGRLQLRSRSAGRLLIDPWIIRSSLI